MVCIAKSDRFNKRMFVLFFGLEVLEKEKIEEERENSPGGTLKRWRLG